MNDHTATSKSVQVDMKNGDWDKNIARAVLHKSRGY